MNDLYLYSSTLYDIADNVFASATKELYDFDLNCCNYNNLRDELIKQYGSNEALIFYHDILSHIDIDLMASEYLSSRVNFD